MGIRSLVLFSCVATMVSLTSSARADVPPTGSGGSTTSTAGAGGASTGDPDCTISVQQIAGSTCQTCDPTGSACTSLGSDFNFVCQASPKVAVWCNGPNRTVPADQNVGGGCSVAVPGGAWGGAAAGALAVAVALMSRRRRRS